MPKTLACGCVFVVMGALVACGSDPSRTSMPTVQTSVDSSRLVTSLSDDEAAQYCHDLASYFTTNFTATEQQELGCVIVASFAELEKDVTTAQSKCKDIYDQCMQQGGGDAGFALLGGGTDSCTGEHQKLASCDGVTVADVNACEVDMLSYEKNQLAGGDAFCGQLIATDGGVGYAPTPVPQSCEKIRAKCPGVVK